jgi:hypothetical protein
MHVEPELRNLIRTPEKEWSVDQVDMARDWNDDVPIRYPRTSVADLRDFHDNYPNFSMQLYLETMLNNLTKWQRVQETFEGTNSTFCYVILIETGQVVTGTPTPRNMGDVQGNLSASSISVAPQKRFIQPDIDGPSKDQKKFDPNIEIPLLGTILRGIELGTSHCPTHVSC